MSWRKVTESDLVSRLSKAEVDAFRQSDDGESDVVAQQIAGEVAYVRGIIRSAPSGVDVASDALALPESLIGPAMDHLRFNILSRMDIAVNESRTKAYEAANLLFEQVRKGDFIPESDGTSVVSTPAGSPLSAKPNPPRLLD